MDSPVLDTDRRASASAIGPCHIVGAASAAPGWPVRWQWSPRSAPGPGSRSPLAQAITAHPPAAERYLVCRTLGVSCGAGDLSAKRRSGYRRQLNAIVRRSSSRGWTRWWSMTLQRRVSGAALFCVLGLERRVRTSISAYVHRNHLHESSTVVDAISPWSAIGELSPSRENVSSRNRHSPLALSASPDRDPLPRGPWSGIFSRA